MAGEDRLPRLAVGNTDLLLLDQKRRRVSPRLVERPRCARPSQRPLRQDEEQAPAEHFYENLRSIFYENLRSNFYENTATSPGLW